MEGLRVSKLEEGQQWGKNTSSKDEVHWGRRPPYIGGGKSNRYPPTQPAQRGTTALEVRYYRSYYIGSTAPDQKLVTSPAVVGTDVFFSTARKQ